MVVKDKKLILEKSCEVASKLLRFLGEESLKFESEDNDPADQIYFIVHSISNFVAMNIVGLNNFGKIYNIPNLDTDIVYSWITTASKEYIDLNAKSNLN